MSSDKKYTFNTSEKPLGNNSVGSLSVLFEDREYYDNVIIPYVQNNKNILFANLIKENFLYGVIDNNQNVILAEEYFIKQLPSADNKPKYALDFVSDAFNQMKAYIGTAVVSGKFSKKSIFSDIKCHRGYTKPDDLFTPLKEEYSSLFTSVVIADKQLNSQIDDPKSFNNKFINFLKRIAKSNRPVTKSSAVLSGNQSVFTSGLIIDIATDKADNDTVKYDKYFSDQEMSAFADTCKRFGFRMDKNVPWRLIADLESPAMQEKTGNHQGYMRRYNISGVDDLFNKRYNLVIYQEIEHLKDLFFTSYQKLFKDVPFYEKDYTKLSSCDFRKGTTGKRNLLSRQEYIKLFDDKYWLRIYVFLRNYEEQRNFDQQQFENVVREASNYINANRTKEALRYVNEYFKQFKNVYYLSSLQDSKNAIEHTSLNLHDLVI